MATQQQVILDIAKCKEISKGINDSKHSCYDILNCQKNKNGIHLVGNDYHLPEPFNGNIENAKILFIGANPNYNSNELYPKSNWNDSDIVNYFLNRKIQKGTPYLREMLDIAKYVYKEKYNTNVSQKIIKSIDSVQSNGCLSIALSDLQISLTEIVHCKSHSFKNVSNLTCNKCVSNHLQNVLSLFKGKYVIMIGDDVKQFTSVIKQFLPKKVKIIFAPYYTSHCPNLTSLAPILNSQI